MNEVVMLPYAKFRLYDSVEGEEIRNALMDSYYTRLSASAETLTLVGGMVVGVVETLRDSVDYLERVVGSYTYLPYVMIEYGTLPAKTCTRRVEQPKVPDYIYAYTPVDAAPGDRIDIFALGLEGVSAFYRGRGTLVEPNLISLKEE